MLKQRPIVPALVLACALTVASCSSESSSSASEPFEPNDPDPVPTPNPSELTCDIDESQIADGGVGLGGIPALDNPPLVAAGSPGTEYLTSPDFGGSADIHEHDRVIVFRWDGQWNAAPHNILWWHEVAHFTGTAGDLVVTYCPLTGSSLVFDFSQLTTNEFQVSGLLFNNNLIMRDPETGSLWPQMLRAAGCGPERGEPLPVVPSIETRWEHRVDLHPDTRVVSSTTGFQRNYNRYPYGSYESPDVAPLFEVDHLDSRRPIKERVLVRVGDLSAGHGDLGSARRLRGRILTPPATGERVPVRSRLARRADDGGRVDSVAGSRVEGPPGVGPGGSPTLVVSFLVALLLVPAVSAGQWVEAPGEGWVQLTVFHHDTRDEFKPDGEVEPFFADGHMITTSTFLTGALGVVPGLDAWGQLPLHHLQFDDAAGERSKAGVGDLRFWPRAGPELLGFGGESPVPVALRAGLFPRVDLF